MTTATRQDHDQPKLHSYRQIMRAISKIALPIAMQMALISSLQLVDNFFLGNLDQAQFVAAGANAVANVTFILSAIIGGFIGGIGIFLIHASQSPNRELKQTIFRVKLVWAIILSIIFVIPASLLIDKLVVPWIPAQNGAQAITFAREYGQIVLPSLLIGFLTLVFSSTLKELKIIKITILISLIGIGVNSILNYLLMYHLGWGIRGGAIATLIAAALEFTIWIWFIMLKKPAFIPKITTWLRVSWRQLWHVFPRSSLWTINQLFLSIGFTLQIMIISRISINSGASLNSAGAFLQLFRSFAGGYAQAMSIIIISYLGQKRNMDLHQQQVFRTFLKKLAILSFGTGLVIGILCSAAAPLIFRIYPKYNWTTNVQSVIMIVSASLMLSISLLCDVAISALKGMGITRSLIVIDVSFSWLIMIPLVVILTYGTNQPISYGWIYALAAMSGILKPWPLFSVMIRAIKNRRHLTTIRSKDA